VTVDIAGCTPSGLDAGPVLITVESSDPTEFDPGLGNPPTDSILAGYFFFDDIEVSPVAPGVDPVTYLSLVVTRVSGGTAVENLELYWTDTNAEEYAVYRDENPYDGIDINYSIPVAVVENSPAIISDFDRNGEYIFTVKARATAGDQSSEMEDSNYAFVDFDNGGSSTDPGNWLYGGNSDYPGQMKMQRGANWGNGGWGYFVDNGLYANACMTMWSCLSTPQVPEIETATVSYIEWAHWYFDCWKPATYPGCNYPDNYPGFTGGGATAPPQLGTGYSDPNIKWMEFDIFYDLPNPPPGGMGDPATHIGYNNPSITFFFGTPTKSAIWHGTNTNWLVSRVNAGLENAGVAYAAVVCATNSSLNNWTNDEGHYFMDDLAVVMY